MTPRRRWTLLPLLLLLAAACDRSPTATASPDTADGIATLAAAIDGLLMADKGGSAMAPGGSLDGLLHQAVDKVARDQGKEAASKLLAPLNQLLSDAAKAAKARDTATARQKLAAARTEEIRIIVSVLGSEAVGSYLASAADRAREWHQKLDDLARAGRDVAQGRVMLATADADIASAGAALKATPPDATRALDLASQATDLLNALAAMFGKSPAPAPPAPAPAWSVTGAFSAALAQISHDRGAAAATAIRDQVTQLEAAAKAALKARDTATANQKLAQARTLQITTIVQTLGKPAVDAALAAVDAALADVRKQVDAARSAGKNVGAAAEELDRAAALERQALEAVGKSQLATAFDLANQAGESVMHAVKRLTLAG